MTGNHKKYPKRRWLDCTMIEREAIRAQLIRDIRKIESGPTEHHKRMADRLRTLEDGCAAAFQARYVLSPGLDLKTMTGWMSAAYQRIMRNPSLFAL